MKGVVLDADTLNPDELDLHALYALPVDWTLYPQTLPEQTQQRIAQADIVLTNKVVLDGSLLQHSRCQYIGVLATGTNNIDTDWCTEHNITVANVEAYGTGSVVQHALMLLLNLTTSFRQFDADVQAGQWEASPFFCLTGHPVSELAGKHLVIVGHGELGRQFDSVCQALGMRVTAAARPGKTDDPRPTLASLLPEADVISLHCPLTPDTDKLINAAALAAMKPGALLINTARGGLIDEPALLEALKSGQLGGAGLDVLSSEPPAPDHPLLHTGLSNLIITPHVAWLARESRQRLLDIAIGHVQDFLAR
ncbi:D-2-hydroxyacid dehydrogenase [Salinimonas lutimaris]|uniref:D-2-hydroxyacid dehydrogenase n=1 Tax=Salinimonas lutimaris TaxID=914153 RepID=UPI0010C10037|nr:D-2-hydroxyacid dehydrogenase [Salinimonas lutimaris]